MKRVHTETHICELNNSTFDGHESDMKANSSYLYREAKVRILQVHCLTKFRLCDVFDNPRPAMLCTREFE